MRDRGDCEGVLLTGLYGSGKSSVAAEMAYLLDRAHVRYAAIDLDWLAWANIDDAHGANAERLMLANLEAVVDNDRSFGVSRFILAGWVTSSSEVDAMRAAVRMPLRVVRLDVPIAEIERRLATDPTTERQQDLGRARAAHQAGEGVGIEDRALDNDRPIGDTAAATLAWLGWA